MSNNPNVFGCLNPNNADPVPTPVLYDKDGYTSFDYLEPFARNHTN
jgi:hypothetical protein